MPILSKAKRGRLLEYFVAGTTARAAGELHRNTAAAFYTRLRKVIAEETQGVSPVCGENEVDESYFGGHRKGKRWLISGNSLPKFGEYRRYIEPFFGGGAIYFHIFPSNAILNDLNAELIEFYRVLRDYPNKLQQLMTLHQTRHSTDYYYEIRSSSFTTDLERAARFLYLNRTCWNGLYRVNLKGVFNVPKGSKDTVILDSDDFSLFSQVLTKAELTIGDFEKSISLAHENDILFVDPPYTVQHNKNNFIKYNEKLFSWNDQVRLHDALVHAKHRGAKIVLCNADHENVRELFSNLGEYRTLFRYSVLSGKSEMRGQTTEAVFIANF